VISKKKKKTEIPIEESPVETEEMTASEQNEAKDISAELEETRQKLLESEEKVLRLAAEFENTKKRLQREREISLKYAEENILKELLPGIDNIERAIEQGKDSKSLEILLEGVEMTRNGLLAILENFGVKPIESIGEPFDPNIHEAVAMEETGDMEPNLVLKEFQKGYSYKDRLLRAAKVIVSKA
jgi:molecular chaperone GrpE